MRPSAADKINSVAQDAFRESGKNLSLADDILKENGANLSLANNILSECQENLVTREKILETLERVIAERRQKAILWRNLSLICAFFSFASALFVGGMATFSRKSATMSTAKTGEPFSRPKSISSKALAPNRQLLAPLINGSIWAFAAWVASLRFGLLSSVAAEGIAISALAGLIAGFVMAKTLEQVAPPIGHRHSWRLSVAWAVAWTLPPIIAQFADISSEVYMFEGLVGAFATLIVLEKVLPTIQKEQFDIFLWWTIAYMVAAATFAVGWFGPLSGVIAKGLAGAIGSGVTLHHVLWHWAYINRPPKPPVR